MNQLETKHVLTGDELSQVDIQNVLSLAEKMKENKSSYANKLAGKQIGLSFDKPSFRTRLSFTAAINHLGAYVIESVAQTRKSEEPKDFIRVMQGYCDAVMIRTFDDETLDEMKEFASIPIINGLTDNFHPCQSLADLLTLKECFESLDGLKIAYIGDGNNILHSLLLMACKLGITVQYCCPKGHEPKDFVLQMLVNKNLAVACYTPEEAVTNCNAVYTDVWTSMGFDNHSEEAFADYQVNKKLMSHAEENAVFMHCMPMQRGKEVTDELADDQCSVIFKQSQNRMYVQQALLLMLLDEEKTSCQKKK